MPSVVNEFGAMPAAPDAFDLRLVDLGGGEAMVEVRTSGGAQRSGVDIEIVLDVSGSMATESEVQDAAGDVQRHGFSTLDVCKHAARCVACSLDDTCRLGLVVYDAQARVVVGLARVTPAHVAKVHAALEKLAPGTSTNLWGGLELGVDELVGGAGDNARAVLLLTDGVPNNSPPEGEVAALRAKRLTKDGSETVAVFAAGFGYALRSDLLLSLAREGGGLFSFVPDAGMVGTSFNHLVASLRSSAAVAAAPPKRRRAAPGQKLCAQTHGRPQRLRAAPRQEDCREPGEARRARPRRHRIIAQGAEATAAEEEETR